MPKVIHERGFLIPAFNTANIDYVACAEQLSDSIKYFHPDANITILTVESLPFGDKKGFANDWQCFYASPYRQTIKLEADTIVTSKIDHWWTLFEKKDVVVSQGARDFYNKKTDCRTYRRVFDLNNLPDLYNAITYWRLSETAQEFFSLVRNIFENWSEWKQTIKMPDDEPSTDLVYAMASVIIGVELTTLPIGFGPSIVHMKKGIGPIKSNDWTQELVWESNPFRVQTIAQTGVFHYQNKQWRINGPSK